MIRIKGQILSNEFILCDHVDLVYVRAIASMLLVLIEKSYPKGFLLSSAIYSEFYC